MKTFDIELIEASPSIYSCAEDVFAIAQENERCLALCEQLQEAFRECETIAEPYLNLAAIFFPNLIEILSGCLLRKGELERAGLSEKEKALYSLRKQYPYCGYRDILEGHLDVREKEYPSGRFKLSPLSHLVNKISYFSPKKIAILGNVGDRAYLTKRFVQKGWVPQSPAETKIFIPKFYEQCTVLRKHLRLIVERFELPFPASQLMGLLENYFLSFLTNQKKKLTFDVLLTGSLATTGPRVLAAQARFEGVPVISVSHGEGHQITHDEPFIGYSDLTFATHFVGYGEEGEKILPDFQYTKGFYGNPVYVASNSTICRKVYHPKKEIQSLSQIANPAYMYVPTKLIGEKRYGPFQNMSDMNHLQFQKIIAKLFPKAVYKQHIKTDHPSLNPGFRVVEKTRFEDSYDQADVYLFDYPSTAFTIAIATGKPIIFFDLGIRNIHPSAVALLKERCIWVDATKEKDSDYLQSEIERQFDKKLVNNFTRLFSITPKNESREDALLHLLETL